MLKELEKKKKKRKFEAVIITYFFRGWALYSHHCFYHDVQLVSKEAKKSQCRLIECYYSLSFILGYWEMTYIYIYMCIYTLLQNPLLHGSQKRG